MMLFFIFSCSWLRGNVGRSRFRPRFSVDVDVEVDDFAEDDHAHFRRAAAQRRAHLLTPTVAQR